VNVIFRYAAGFAWDAAEAVAEWLNCNRAADSLYDRTQAERRLAADRLAEAEAEEEVTEPECRCQTWFSHSSPAEGVAPNPSAGEVPRQEFPPGVGHPNLTKNELRDLAEAARNAARNYNMGGFAWRHLSELSEKTFRIAHAMK
jgi:hypothetical protein